MSGVCKFFQTNSCRYGNRCRFKHVYEEQQFYDSRNPKSSGTSILKSGPSHPKTSYQPQSREDIDLKRFTEDVAISVKSIEEQGIWPLSCFGCVQSYGNLEGFEDVSPEELRFKAYEARAAGKFQLYIEETQVLLKKAAAVRSVFIGKGPTASSILHTYYLQGAKKESNSSGTNVFGNTTTFNQNVQTYAPPPNKSVYGMSNVQEFQLQHQPQQNSAFNTNIFAQALRDGPSEMQSSFGQPIQRHFFDQSVPDAPQPMQTFGQNVGTDFFNQNIFGNAIQSSQTGGVFFQPQIPVQNMPFGQQNFMPQGNSKEVSLNVLYSQVEHLTPEELEQYRATTFTCGKTPLKPPPKELC